MTGILYHISVGIASEKEKHPLGNTSVLPVFKILMRLSRSCNGYIIPQIRQDCKRKRKTPDGGQMSLSKMNFENLCADPVFDYIIMQESA